MAKSQRSKREKRLRSIRRELTEPFYDKKEAAKLAAQEAALSAPKLPVRSQNTTAGDNAMETTSSTNNTITMDVDMAEGGNTNDQSSRALKAVGGVGKKLKKKLKIGKKGKRRGKGGKIRRKAV